MNQELSKEPEVSSSCDKFNKKMLVIYAELARRRYGTFKDGHYYQKRVPTIKTIQNMIMAGFDIEIEDLMFL